jgi:hypothetical protein
VRYEILSGKAARFLFCGVLCLCGFEYKFFDIGRETTSELGHLSFGSRCGVRDGFRKMC